MTENFEPQLKAFVARIPSIKEKLTTEESTKNSLIMPMLNLLGYNVFDPEEITPEYTADFGTKQKEKVDYAVMKNGEPIILIECKPVNMKLAEKQCSQLYRYFSVCSAKIGLLTNGIEYRFYSDLEEENKMDSKPFYILNLEELKDDDIPKIAKFCKDVFDVDNIITQGQKLKEVNALMEVILKEIDSPSDELTKLIGKRVYDGVMNQKNVDKYKLLIKATFSQIIADKLNAKIKALQSSIDQEVIETPNEPEEPTNQIVTTEEEMMGFAIVRAIGSRIVPIERITMRDAASYCAIFCDNNNRRPIVKMHFNSSTVKYLSTFDKEGKETKNKIESVRDIYKYQDQIIEAISRWIE